LGSPALNKNDLEPDKSDTWKSTLEKDYSHLSAEQQERYADLQRNIVPAGLSKNQEMEL
jgi:hypothetical protein